MSGNFVCGPDTKEVQVIWDGSLVGTHTFTKSGTWTTANMEWTPVHMVLANPSTTSTELKFVDISGGITNCGVALDNIVVDPPTIPVPEFPSIALPAAFLVGLIGTVLFIRSTREN